MKHLTLFDHKRAVSEVYFAIIYKLYKLIYLIIIALRVHVSCTPTFETTLSVIVTNYAYSK